MSCLLSATPHSQLRLVPVLVPVGLRFAGHSPFPHRSAPYDLGRFSIERELPHEFANIPHSW